MQVPVATHPPHGEAARALASRIGEALPPSLVTLWRESGAGVLLVSPEIDRPYLEPGRVAWRHVRCRGGLFVPLEPEPAALWEVIGGWLDLFGGGHVSGARLSGGGGRDPVAGGGGAAAGADPSPRLQPGAGGAENTRSRLRARCRALSTRPGWARGDRPPTGALVPRDALQRGVLAAGARRVGGGQRGHGGRERTLTIMMGRDGSTLPGSGSDGARGGGAVKPGVRPCGNGRGTRCI